MEIKNTKVILVGLNPGNDFSFEHHMEELEDLCEACGYEVAGVVTQVLPRPHSALYIGAGKVQEVKSYAESLEADIIVFDDALSPSQVRNLNEAIGLPIMDRTAVILEIFASRAKTREARLQVDLARYQYLLPRLTGMGQALSRQGGSASSNAGARSNRGAGETKLELDRRRIEHRITELNREVEEIKKQRAVQRRSRARSRICQVSLVGYTNAGKSTILNQFLLKYGNRDVKDAEAKTVLQQDMLFATLDTTVRRLTPAGRPPFYLSDTVGFIEKLPHHLVDAFRSTLEEVCAADLLVQVVDISDPHYREQMEVTRQTLAELGAGDIPMITVYNKADLAIEDSILSFSQNAPTAQAGNASPFGQNTVAARTGAGDHPLTDTLPIVNREKLTIRMAAGLGVGLDELLDLICEQLFGSVRHVRLLLPYREAALLDDLTRESDVSVTEYREDGIYVEAGIPCKEKLYTSCLKYALPQ
ncbi:MAG: GTPase HflX [Lachnospiraceae bacterium]|nr:GTPase HflX [Lachnospiraceae bacterium]